MELLGRIVRLRPLAAEDLTKMVHWNTDEEVQLYVDADFPEKLGELQHWFSQSFPNRQYQIFAIETSTGELIGDLELDHICWNRQEAELRIRLGEKAYWGQGYGSDAVRQMINYCFNDKGFRRLYLRVYAFNQRAIRCYEKNGFKQIGILHSNRENWKDIILMEIKAPAVVRQRSLNRVG